MSQNKTVILGLEPGNANISNNYCGESSCFYSRSGQSNARGAIVPARWSMRGMSFKWTLLLVFLFFFVVFSSAKNQPNALVLHKSNGKSVVIMLGDTPKLSFEGADIIIQTHLMNVAYSSKDILGFTYEFVSTASIDKINSNSNICFKRENSHIFITGLDVDSSVMVFSLDGKVLSSIVANSDRNAIINLANIPVNVCVVKTSVGTFKISK
ncbi:hypothetical protein JQM97_14675 [Prevotella hominis]|uniref:hypothetical protein n=1 Tax=Segatella hominis TaxID=2518605 RepID=UPI001F1C3766|nr:hypothetical protein [Segatella hominis]MCF2592156.1 hypothetical protein [Segatella hominis]